MKVGDESRHLYQHFKIDCSLHPVHLTIEFNNISIHLYTVNLFCRLSPVSINQLINLYCLFYFLQTFFLSLMSFLSALNLYYLSPYFDRCYS